MMELVSEFEIPYLSPVHHGYPAWPGGERRLQLYQANASAQVVLTRGLSNGNDHPFEIYLETDDLTDVESFGSSWHANLVYELGRIIPNVNDLAKRLDINRYLTVQIEIEGAPPEWSFESEDGNIGLFLGLDNAALTQFIKPSIPLNLKLMRPRELQYSIEKGQEGRLKLASLYLQQGNATISNLERASVV
jgi:hypothetical protein